MDGDSRKILKTAKNLPAAFSKLCGLDVKSEEAFMPTYLHSSCSQQVDRAYQSKKNAVDDLPKIKRLVTRLRKCKGNKYKTGHNRESCPQPSAKFRRKKKKLLMELTIRENEMSELKS